MHWGVGGGEKEEEGGGHNIKSMALLLWWGRWLKQGEGRLKTPALIKQIVSLMLWRKGRVNSIQGGEGHNPSKHTHTHTPPWRWKHSQCSRTIHLFLLPSRLFSRGQNSTFYLIFIYLIFTPHINIWNPSSAAVCAVINEKHDVQFSQTKRHGEGRPGWMRISNLHTHYLYIHHWYFTVDRSSESKKKSEFFSHTSAGDDQGERQCDRNTCKSLKPSRPPTAVILAT